MSRSTVNAGLTPIAGSLGSVSVGRVLFNAVAAEDTRWRDAMSSSPIVGP